MPTQVKYGGTGLNTLTANNVILGNGTSQVQLVAPGTSGYVLTSNGTTWTSAAPSGGVTSPVSNYINGGYVLVEDSAPTVPDANWLTRTAAAGAARGVMFNIRCTAANTQTAAYEMAFYYKMGNGDSIMAPAYSDIIFYIRGMSNTAVYVSTFNVFAAPVDLNGQYQWKITNNNTPGDIRVQNWAVIELGWIK